MDDYISREAAITEILSEPTDAHYPSWYAEKLKQIPAADVRPVVMGEWLMPNADKTDRPMPECSVCGWYVTEEAAMEFTFCPNCGADMREPNLDATKGDSHD